MESSDEITPYPFTRRTPSLGNCSAGNDSAEPRPPAVDRSRAARMSGRQVRVLLVEASSRDARVIRDSLAEVHSAAFALEHVSRLDAARARLLSGGIDVILLDLALPDARDLEAFLVLHAAAPTVPVVVLTGLDDEELAVRAVQHGAQDYLVKGQADCPLLVRSLRYAVERTRRYQAERTLRATQEKIHAAHEIQQRLFPAQAPALPGLDLAGASFPAEATGGDYYDYLPMPAGRVGLVVGDVSGHGFGPALLMASTRAYLRALAQAGHEVDEVLRLANRLVGDEIGADHFVTLLLVRLDPVTRTLYHAGAGHPTGYVLDAAGVVKARLESEGPPLGVLPGAAFATRGPLQLAAGDLVLLLTDGLADARGPDGQPFGTERVLRLARHYRRDPARVLVRNLYHAVTSFTHNLPQDDDLTAVVLKVEG
jgi:sigma-B regulation protein RsbU (phosphoserine phosphatase)